MSSFAQSLTSSNEQQTRATVNCRTILKSAINVTKGVRRPANVVARTCADSVVCRNCAIHRVDAGVLLQCRRRVCRSAAFLRGAPSGCWMAGIIHGRGNVEFPEAVAVNIAPPVLLKFLECFYVSEVEL